MTGSGQVPKGRSRISARLDDDSQRAARVVALRLLARVRKERKRLADSDDQSALHDFRVAVRRLRSWIEIRRVMPARLVSKRGRRLLRRLARTTNASRDDEVFAEWLAVEREALPEPQRATIDWLLAWITARRLESGKASAAEIARDLDRAGTLLGRQLTRYAVPHHVEDGSLAESFATALSAMVRIGSARLHGRLRAIKGSEDTENIHRARIAAKLVRYQLDAVATIIAGAKACVSRLKVLQDVLGDHHDACVWRGAVGEAVAQAPDVAVRDGLAALSERIDRRATERFDTLRSDWLTGEPALFPALDALADALARRRREGVEVERRYLLRRMPPNVPHGVVRRIDQGYLPGERLVERVRRVRTGRRVQHVRTVKAGRGIARFEVEERCTRGLFASLWPLTKGRRVVKRRHEVRDGELTWSIDVFTGRDLVLAEVELPSRSTRVTLPDWLSPHVVREVTGKAGYTNSALAR